MLYYNILQLNKHPVNDEKDMLENIFFNLLLWVPDTDFAKLIDGYIETGSIYDEIYQRIEKNLETKGLLKKQAIFYIT